MDTITKLEYTSLILLMFGMLIMAGLESIEEAPHWAKNIVGLVAMLSFLALPVLLIIDIWL